MVRLMKSKTSLAHLKIRLGAYLKLTNHHVGFVAQKQKCTHAEMYSVVTC